jgi:hypothetical protein
MLGTVLKQQTSCQRGSTELFGAERCSVFAWKKSLGR